MAVEGIWATFWCAERFLQDPGESHKVFLSVLSLNNPSSSNQKPVQSLLGSILSLHGSCNSTGSIPFKKPYSYDRNVLVVGMIADSIAIIVR